MQLYEALSMHVATWREENYEGRIFNITLADVPERKTDLVEGKYTMEAKKGATIAVKMTDMLGEEVLVVKQVQ